MAGVTAHGASFSFSGIVAQVTGISVESPSAEVTDMTGINHNASQMVIVPTGAWAGGTITVDFIYASGDPQTVVRRAGALTFTSDGFSVSRRAILESASVSASAGEIVRGSLKFRLTDYLGT